MKARLTHRGLLAMRLMEMADYKDADTLMARIGALEERHGSAEKALEILGQPTTGKPKVLNS